MSLGLVIVPSLKYLWFDRDFKLKQGAHALLSFRIKLPPYLIGVLYIKDILASNQKVIRNTMNYEMYICCY